MPTPRLPWDVIVPEASDQRDARTRQEPAPHAPSHGARIRVCVHGSAAVRLAAVQRHARAHAGRGIRVLAPTHDHAHDAVRHVLADMPASLGVDRGGWVGFSVRLATPALIARGLTPVSGLGFEAVVARVVARAREEDALGYFGDASRHPGFVPSLARTLTDLRLAGVEPAQVASADWSADEASAGDRARDAARRRDLARLLDGITASLAELGHADRADVLRLAVAAVRASTDDDTALPLALVDIPLASRHDADLAAALVSRSAAVLVTAPVGDAWTARLLASLDAQDVEDKPVAEHDTTPAALGRVQAGLFASASSGDAPRAGDDSVTFISAPGEGRECVEVVRALLTHAERGTPFDRMAIVMRAPELYASHLETALRRAGIPAYFGRGTRRPDPSGRAFLALLACAVEDLSARRFAEYLSLGQVPGDVPRRDHEPAHESQRVDEAEALGLGDSAAGDTDDGSEAGPEGGDDTGKRSPWRWEAVLNDAQVIAGADRWGRRLRGYREEMVLRAESALKDDPSSPRHESLARRVTWTDELLEFAGDVIGDMSAWPAADDWRGWIDRLRALAPRVLARPDRVTATLAELHPLDGVAHVSLAEVRDVLHDRLTHLAVPPPAHRYGRVFVGTPDQVRARVFDVVCVPGLSERVFPQRSRQDPLLLDGERAAISPDLAVDDDRLAGERVQLRLAAGAASRVLLASYASMDTAQARPRVPSFYAVDVQRAVSGRVPGYEDLIRDAQQRSGARLAWPAPQDPTSAIDAAEHDLGTLQRYLRGGEADVRGRARYLFDLNPALRRALIARHQRLARHWTAHDGLVIDPATLAAHRLQARTYSASALQRYATCPYQFYLSTILRLEPREDAMPLTTLDPLTRGSMVHEMLARIMRELIARGWAPLDAAHVPDAEAIADALVTEVAAAHADALMPPIARVWEDAVAVMRRDVLGWVRRLPSEGDGDAWTPVHVEMGLGFSGGFGLDEASRREHVVLPDGTRLHGVVDLIERRGVGEYRITDYKTGRYRLRDNVVVNGGRTLQPILYAMAVEAAFEGRVTSSRLYYCTTDGDYRSREWPTTGADGDDTRRQGLDVLAHVDQAVAAGTLPAAPDAEACTWCDFAAVCGPDAQHQNDRKDRKAIADLIALRRVR